MAASATCNASASLPHLMLHRNIDAGLRHARPRPLTLSTGAPAVADSLIDLSYAS
jgi:hypothetical protein